MYWMKEKIRRIKNQKRTKPHFGKDDIIIEDYHINAVHMLPEKFTKDSEIDFYLRTYYDVYLLRFRHRKKHRIYICPATKTCPLIYIIVETQLHVDTFLEDLNNSIKELEKFGLPKIKNVSKQILLEDREL